MKGIDITGQRFGKWTVLRYLGNKRGNSRFLCRCDCGTEKPVLSDSLRHNKSTSCKICRRAYELSEHWFYQRVRKTDSCWLWIGFIDNYGYGVIGERGKAHRLSWAYANGPIPIGFDVLHRCDVPACIRPDHLFLGTQADNNADMFAKGRAVWPQGEDHGSAKLTEAQVREIRASYVPRSAHASLNALARSYGVSKRTVLFIVQGKHWRYVA